MSTGSYHVLLLCVAALLAQPYQLPLTRTPTSDPSGNILYTAQLHLNKQQAKLKVNLSNEQSWVKSNICYLCDGGKCEEKCSGKLGEGNGVACNARKPCVKINETVNTSLIEGYRVKVNMTSEDSKEAAEIKFVIATRLHKPLAYPSQTKKYDGELNLLHGEDYVFEKFSVYRSDSKTKIVIDDKIKEVTKDDEEISLQTDSNQIQIQSMQFGENDVDMSKTSAEVSLNHRQILLPKDTFNNLMKWVTKDLPDCNLKERSIVCNGTTGVEDLKKKVFRLKLQDHQFSFLFEALIAHSNKSEIQFLVNSTQEDKIILGQIFYENYGVTFDLSKKQMYFQRLKNKWSAKMQKQQKQKVKENTNSDDVEEESEEEDNKKSKFKGAIKKIKNKIKQKFEKNYKEQIVEPEDVYPTGFFNKLFFYIHKIILFLVKLIVWLVIIVIIINIFYNRKRISKWFDRTFGDSLSNLLNRDTKGYSPAFEQQIDPTPTIAQGYDAKTATKQFWQENSVQGI